VGRLPSPLLAARARPGPSPVAALTWMPMLATLGPPASAQPAAAGLEGLKGLYVGLEGVEGDVRSSDCKRQEGRRSATIR